VWFDQLGEDRGAGVTATLGDALPVPNALMARTEQL